MLWPQADPYECMAVKNRGDIEKIMISSLFINKKTLMHKILYKEIASKQNAKKSVKNIQNSHSKL